MNQSRKSFGIALMAVGFVLSVAAQSSAQRNTDAGQFLTAHEPELQQASGAKRIYLLGNLAPAALAANDTARARAYAEELLILGPATRSQPGFGESNYGEATHVGNVVLGRIALMNGDVAKAKEQLLAAGRIPGSPSLNSFGPDMLLAKELIEKGERNTAIEYFDLCSKFWANDRGRLQQWKTTVAQGGMPNFGANLGYIFSKWQFAK